MEYRYPPYHCLVIQTDKICNACDFVVETAVWRKDAPKVKGKRRTQDAQKLFIAAHKCVMLEVDKYDVFLKPRPQTRHSFENMTDVEKKGSSFKHNDEQPHLHTGTRDGASD